MQISYQWLRNHIELHEPAAQISSLLTKSGLEVESVKAYEKIKGGLKGLVIGKVMTCERHPQADKLSKTKVMLGNDVVVPIVCGASNVAAGQKVIVATVGTTLYAADGSTLVISKAKIRGEVSEGMICAEDEIGLGNSHEGIMVLDTELPEGTPAAVYFNMPTDNIFEIGLTPNRADAASHLGVARDLSVVLQRPLLKAVETKFAKADEKKEIQINIENKAACPRYSGVVISNLKVATSPDWLLHALKSIGIAPINNVVDITNYILHDLGQPLHAFDYDTVAGKTIVVKNVAEQTLFTTLDGVERKLKAHDLLICDAEKPLSLAGLFGGKNSGVSNSTTTIFLESAYFMADVIRKSSIVHGIKTDASFRFERGTDPELPIKALHKAIALLQEIAGGKVASEIFDFYPEKIAPFEITVSYNRINQLIGIEIEKYFVKQTLQALEIKILNENDDMLLLNVPSYRVDVQREADIVEEVLRFYGYDNIALNPHLQSGYVAPFAENNSDKVQKVIAELLVGKNFNEIITNSLTKSSYAALIGKGETDVKILNPLSETLDVMRQTLLFSGLEVLLHNINRKQKDLKVYEFGKTYHLQNQKYVEQKRLIIFTSGSVGAESWQQKQQPIDLYFLKSIVADLLVKMGISKIESIDTQNNTLEFGVDIIARQKVLVSMGKVKAQLTKTVGVKQPVFVADIDMDLLEKMYSNKVVYEEIAKFPEVRRDLSLVLDKNITFDQIRQLAFKQERKLMKEVNVFDIYEGEKIEQNKKSYSISFILQNAEQTLTEEIIDKAMNKLIATYEKELNALIRK